VGYSHHAMAYACVSRALPLATVRLLGFKFPVKVPGRNERLLSSLMGRMPDLRLIAFRGDPHAKHSSHGRAGSTMSSAKSLFFH
jgi:hypothetical protein